MQNARFDGQHLASELKAVIQELKMYKDDYVSMMLEKIKSLLYPANHPYHYPVIGYKEDLLNLSSENLHRFYKKHYHPDRAVLFVIGDVNPEEVIALAKEQFEDITSESESMIQSFPVLHDSLETQHTRFYEDVATEQLGFYWRIPGKKSEHEVVATAAASLLGDGEGSRLYRALVDEHKVASDVCVYAQKFMESGIFLVLVEPVSGKSTECRCVIEQELAKVIEYGFDDKELEYITKSQGKRFFQRLQRFTNFTYEWLTSYFATGDEYAVFNRVNKFVEIQSSHVQDFIQDCLDPFLMNQIEVLPMPERKRELSEQIKRESDTLDKEILSKYRRTVPVEPPKFALTISEPEPLDFVFPKPDKKFVLDNGLTVLFRQNRSLPLLSVSCKFKDYFYFSSAKEGIPLGVMMDMLIEKSDGYSKQDNVDFFEFYGVDYSFGKSGGHLSLLSSDVKKIFERFLYVLCNPVFESRALEKVRAIEIDSFMRSKDDPIQVAVRELRRSVYKDHPFGWSFEQALDELEQLSPRDLKTLHEKYINPENMILSIAGDFDINTMEKIIKGVFGQWVNTGERITIEYPESVFDSQAKIDTFMLRDQVVLAMGQPSPVTIEHPDLIPLKLLNYIGFHSLGSRIFQLRQRSGLFYDAFGAWAAGAGHEHGFDYVGAILSPDKVALVEQKMRALIDGMARDGVTQEEVSAARQLYLKTLIDAISTNASVAEVMCTLEVFGLGFDYYDNVLKRIQSMSIAELNSTCAKYFNTDKMVRIRVGRVGQAT